MCPQLKSLEHLKYVLSDNIASTSYLLDKSYSKSNKGNDILGSGGEMCLPVPGLVQVLSLGVLLHFSPVSLSTVHTQ